MNELRVVDVDQLTSGQGARGARRDLAGEILNMMNELKPEESIHPRILAKKLRLSCKSDVNPFLYRLQKEGKVMKVADCPPLWKRGLSSSLRSERAFNDPTLKVLEAGTSVSYKNSAGSSLERWSLSTLRCSKLDDKLASLVTDAYKELCKSLQCFNDHCCTGSITSFVVQNAGEFRLVALGSCASFNDDSRAACSEAMRSAHRSFKRFLCRQLTDFHLRNGDRSSILERCRENPAMFKLKDGISVHLYWSNYETTPKTKDNVETKCNRYLKTEGRAVPLAESDYRSLTIDQRQKLDESLRRPPDQHFAWIKKISKWAVVGLQGGLLSNYLSPIYLDTVTIGSSSAAECKAFLSNWELLAKLGTSPSPLLPPIFKLTIPKLGKVSTIVSSSMGMCCNQSTNWSLGDSSLEVIDGKSDDRLCSGNGSGSSILSERNVFKDFLFLCRLTGRHDLFNMKTFSECKCAAFDYLFASALFRTQLGEFKV